MTTRPPKSSDRSPAEEDRTKADERQEEILDEALEETFPASDPIAPATVPRRR